MNHYTRIFLVVLLCIVCFFPNLDVLEPDLMEARNFVTAREMIQKENWLIPTMNDQLRLEKQPLVTWFTALSAQLGNGLSDHFIMRLPASIIATLMVLFFYGLCYELSQRHNFAFLGSIVFATSLLVVQMARVNTWDIFTHAFMTGSIWMQVKAMRNTGRNLHDWIFAGILMGLSIFSKGPVSLYALWIPFMIGYFGVMKQPHARRNITRMIFMIVIALVVGLSWNMYIYFKIPEEVSAVFAKETSSRVSRHLRPFYFYLHFAAYIGIWAIPLLAALIIKPLRNRVKATGNFRFLFSWLLIGLVLLSVIPEKKERYMLPLEIPMSLLVAYLLDSVYRSMNSEMSEKSEIILLKLQGWIMVVLLTAMPVLAIMTLKSEYLALTNILALLISVTMVLLLIRKLVSFSGSRSFKAIFISSAMVMVLISLFYLPVLARIIYKPDFKNITSVSKSKEFEQMPFISASELNMELIWRIGRSVKPVEFSVFDKPVAEKSVFYSYLPVEQLLSAQQLSGNQFKSLGIFDCNQDIKSDCKIYVYLIQHKDM